MSNDTKERILKSAIDVFGVHPFHDATVAMICEAADANVAAINYYFQSKEALFFEVFRAAFEIANAVYPLDGNLAEDAPAEQKLRAFIAALIHRSLDSGRAGHFNRIINHEARLPHSDRREQVYKEVRILELNYLEAIISKLFPQLNDEQLAQARMNVISLAATFSISPMAKSRFFPKPPTPEQIEAYIERQFAFALEGIRALSQAS